MSSNDKLPSLPVSRRFLLLCVVAAVRGGRLEALVCQVEVIWSSAMGLEIPSGSQVSGSEAARGGIFQTPGERKTGNKNHLR